MIEDRVAPGVFTADKAVFHVPSQPEGYVPEDSNIASAAVADTLFQHGYVAAVQGLSEVAPPIAEVPRTATAELASPPAVFIDAGKRYVKTVVRTPHGAAVVGTPFRDDHVPERHPGLEIPADLVRANQLTADVHQLRATLHDPLEEPDAGALEASHMAHIGRMSAERQAA